VAKIDIINQVKRSLGITHGKLDGDIDDTIKAAKADMGIAGVEGEDALVTQAIKLYARYIYNYQGQSERWERAYRALKDAMALCGDYKNG
jgi:Cu/Ag efflux pump CusA